MTAEVFPLRAANTVAADRTEAMTHHGQTGAINGRDLTKNSPRKFKVPHGGLEIPWCS